MTPRFIIPTQDAPGFQYFENDPDISAQATFSPKITKDSITNHANGAEVSTITLENGATFICLELLRDWHGLYFLLAPEGARAFAAALISSAEETEQALARQATAAMAPILNPKGDAA